MIDKVLLTNLTNQTSLNLTKSFGNNYLIETIDWDAVPATHNKYNNLTGVGNTITSTKLESRTIAITGRVCSKYTKKQIADLYGVSTLEEINNKKIEEIEVAKKQLSQVINPLHYIRINAGEYYIDGKPDSSVVFSDKESENNEIYCKFTFSLTCSDPLFHYSTSTETQLSGIYGGFHFPVTIPRPNGMHFGIQRSFQLVVVNNSGDISLGGIIYIKATGIVVNPIITNVYTQDSIRIVKTLTYGEVVKIDTVNRKVTGAPDGITFQNYFSYWDFSNKWFMFDIGDTLFGFSADDETYKSMDVWVEINKSFYSMEDQ